MKKLQAEKAWCNWRKEARGGKPTKVPYQPDGFNSKSNDPNTWHTFDEVNAARGRFDGIGFFFAGSLCGVDIDGAHDEAGTQNPLEDAVLKLFQGTYAELSPSGNGRHILFYVDRERLKAAGILTDDGKWNAARFYKKNPNNGLECYCAGFTNRYFTYTGNKLDGYPDEIADKTDALIVFLYTYMRKPDKPEKPADPDGTDPIDDDDPALNAAQGADEAVDITRPAEADIDIEAQLKHARRMYRNFEKLYDKGDKSDYINKDTGKPDDSAADMALCNMLAKMLYKYPALMDKAFRHSKLMRSKWDSMRGGVTYGQMTIQKAIDGTPDKDMYDPNYNSDPIDIDAAINSFNAATGAGDDHTPTAAQEAREASLVNALEDAAQGGTRKKKKKITDEMRAQAFALRSEFKFNCRRIKSDGEIDFDDLTDSGNADRFKDLYRDKLRHVKEAGKSSTQPWRIWDGKSWKPDSGECFAQEFTEWMLLEARAYYNLADKDEDGKTIDPDPTNYLRWAKQSRNGGKISALLAMAENKMNVKAGEFDADRWALNTPAGIVDLRTGEMKPHDPAALCSKITACSPTREGGELWEKCLDEWSCGDESWIEFAQLLAGFCLIGENTSETLVFATGTGGNGKSTLFNTMLRVIGDYGTTLDPNALMADYRGNAGAQKAFLQGARMVTCGETEPGKYLSISGLKQFASNDEMQAEVKFEMPHKFMPSHTICMYNNVLPLIKVKDDGTWRRLIVMPFLAPRFEGADKDMRLSQKLFEKCGGYALQWMIDGAVKLREYDYDLEKAMPECVKAATDEYRYNWSMQGEFVESYCMKDPSAKMTDKALYAAFEVWAKATGHDYIPRMAVLNDYMRKNGFKSSKHARRDTWQGIRLKTEAEMTGALPFDTTLPAED